MSAPTRGKVPRQAERLAAEASQDFEAFYVSREAYGPELTLDPLVMSLGGNGIGMRRDDLRGATHQAAERAQHKLKTRLSQAEKRSRKRMAAVAIG